MYQKKKTMFFTFDQQQLGYAVNLWLNQREKNSCVDHKKRRLKGKKNKTKKVKYWQLLR